MKFLVINQTKVCNPRASSPTELPWMFTHRREVTEGDKSPSVWPLNGVTRSRRTRYQTDLVNWTNHLWLSADPRRVIQQSQRSFFIMCCDITAWIVEAVCRVHAGARTTDGGGSEGGEVFDSNCTLFIQIYLNTAWLCGVNIYGEGRGRGRAAGAAAF